jgi:hypothetical protein
VVRSAMAYWAQPLDNKRFTIAKIVMTLDRDYSILPLRSQPAVLASWRSNNSATLDSCSKRSVCFFFRWIVMRLLPPALSCASSFSYVPARIARAIAFAPDVLLTHFSLLRRWRRQHQRLSLGRCHWHRKAE